MLKFRVTNIEVMKTASYQTRYQHFSISIYIRLENIHRLVNQMSQILISLLVWFRNI